MGDAARQRRQGFQLLGADPLLLEPGVGAHELPDLLLPLGIEMRVHAAVAPQRGRRGLGERGIAGHRGGEREPGEVYDEVQRPRIAPQQLETRLIDRQVMLHSLARPLHAHDLQHQQDLSPDL